MSYGLAVYKSSGALAWDSTQAVGGVVAEIASFTSGGTGTLTYPLHAGRSVFIVHLLIDVSAGGDGVAVDTSLGYPRVTVTAASTPRRFAVVVY